jgi:23S rRNA (uridine2552-2'-O)-methyltransferase
VYFWNCFELRECTGKIGKTSHILSGQGGKGILQGLCISCKNWIGVSGCLEKKGRSWFLYVSKKVGEKGFVLGVDLVPLKIETPSNALFLQKSAMELETEDVLQYMGGYDAVVSDMAPFTSGVRGLDGDRSLELSFRALKVAGDVLKNGGTFVCKVLEGEEFPSFVSEVKRDFSSVKLIKPRATRKESRELYVVAQGYKKRG